MLDYYNLGVITRFSSSSYEVPLRMLLQYNCQCHCVRHGGHQVAVRQSNLVFQYFPQCQAPTTSTVEPKPNYQLTIPQPWPNIPPTPTFLIIWLVQPEHQPTTARPTPNHARVLTGESGLTARSRARRRQPALPRDLPGAKCILAGLTPRASA
ncbi:hypothetical protein Bbelb_412710 [Branchiostoma belcheri]|nr:hypothetical protein Bbelb_412710 [Branchiostoma belcheri]